MGLGAGKMKLGTTVLTTILYMVGGQDNLLGDDLYEK